MKCPKCDSENTSDSRFCKNCATPLPDSDRVSLSHTETLQTPFIELTRDSTFAGRYKVIEELGRGGMGKVYRVVDKKIDEEVALKLLKPEISDSARTIERFRNELKLARKISHSNVCRMYHFGEDEGIQFITMEYVQGEDLKTTIRRVGPLSSGKAIHIIKQVCEGLAEAHKLGVVHRDLKPHNIMIDREGNAKIMDFGIARSLKATGLTGTGVMIGTPDYMSPEQAGGKKVDRRSDIYSLGVILYEMVAGEVPFKGDTALSVAVQHITEAAPDPKEINPQIPDDLSRLILKCMEKDKEKRYQDAEALLNELNNIERGIPTTDRVLPKGMTWLKTSENRFRSFVVPGIVVVGVMLIVGGYFLFNRYILTKKSEEENVPVKASEKTVQSPEVITPQYGNIEISSTPGGAEVYLNNKKEGETPLKRELLPGTYKIKIRKPPDYQDLSDTLEVKTGETFIKNYSMTLVPVAPARALRSPPTRAVGTKTAPEFTLKISSIPEGADVRIDGDYKGKTPVQIKLQKSRCRLKIEKGQEWSKIDETLTLKPGMNPVHRELKRMMYSLSIKTNPSEARVSIGGKPFGTSPVEKLVPVGLHPLKLEKKGYRTIEESINMESDIAKTYNLPGLQTGKIRLKVQPYADVLIDGKLIGEVPPIRIQEVTEGKHTVEFVSTRLEKKYTVEVNIGPGESKEVRMNMETGIHRVVKLDSL